MHRLLGLALATLALTLSLAGLAGAQALPSLAVIGSPDPAPGPTAVINCGACVINQGTASTGEQISAPFAGRLTEWSVTTSGSGTVSLLGLRIPAGSPSGIYTVFAQTPAQAVGPGTAKSTFTANIPIQTGDIIAVQTSGGTGVIATAGTDGTISTGSLVSASSVSSSGTQAGTLALGATVVRTPSIISLTPNSGPTAGGTSVTITGQNLDLVTNVLFGSTPATSYSINGVESITAIAPAATATGQVAVSVVGSAGTATASTGPAFTYALPLTPAPAGRPTTSSPSSTRCRVPKLTGLTVAGARRALKRAHCKLGKVTRASKGAKRVVRQSVPRKTTKPVGAKVNVKLG